MILYRQIRLALLPALVILASGCGSSGGSPSEPVADGAADGTRMAVSASPPPAGEASTKDLSKTEPVVRPGADAPLDSMPDRISKQAGQRLFATGFEEGVALQRIDDSPYQQLIGADGSGFSFPISLGAARARWPSLVFADLSAHHLPAAAYAQSELKEVLGRNGNPTRALSLHSKYNSWHPQQISMGSSGLASDPVVFQRMWIKFDANTLQRARQTGAGRFYQTFWEVSGEGEESLRLKLQYDDAQGLVWIAQGNGVAGGQPDWSDRLSTAPVEIAPESSAQGWHKVEIWLDPKEGRFKVAIDGHTLVDRAGVLIGNGGDWIRDFRMMMVASTVAPLAEVLFDELELWTFPPEDAFAPPAN